METRKIINKGRGYSGLEKINLYQYDKKGKFLQKYNSQQELRNKYYPNDKSKRPLLRSKRAKFNYDILPDGTFYSNEKIGRKIVTFEKIINSKFVTNQVQSNIPIDVFNIIGEKIATFQNHYIASLLTNISYGVILKDCKIGKSIKQKDLTFRFSI